MERKMGGKNGVTRPFHLALLCLAPLCCFLPFSNGSSPFLFFRGNLCNDAADFGKCSFRGYLLCAEKRKSVAYGSY